MDLGITYKGHRGSVSLTAWSDSDWASDANRRRSTTGLKLTMNGRPVVFKSKLQRTVALSAAEAEYTVVSMCTQVVLWARALLEELGHAQPQPTKINTDNKSAIPIAKNVGYSARAKHYVPSASQLADFLTKPIEGRTLQRLGVWPQDYESYLILVPSPFHSSTRIIKVDFVNYALEAGRGVNLTAMNALELLDLQKEIATAFKKRRGALPNIDTILKGISHLLSAPYTPTETVPIIKPTSSGCGANSFSTQRDAPQKTQIGSVYEDPESAGAIPESEPDADPALPRHARPNADDVISLLSSDSSDVAELCSQNALLRKRPRCDSDASSAASHPADSYHARADPRETRSVRLRASFSPSATQLLVHNKVVHQDHAGEDPQALLELTQYSSHAVKFLAPVLRGLFEFGFDDRGLQLMHCKLSTAAGSFQTSDRTPTPSLLAEASHLLLPTYDPVAT
ncbi:hypothetical protein P43SY_008551 [Pythium insidiosum]|uniref:Uncharacterized protein n=1 Tax=Pythium insidiosum TaxID=114742 RepID=A0AAD5M7I8_PYTIN|nr:hypothetical protein P43SY_008551 [Pythium insidiosum]